MEYGTIMGGTIHENTIIDGLFNKGTICCP